ncbi:MAG: V-type ATPase subunit [candidate division WOR-3 bacterium]
MSYSIYPKLRAIYSFIPTSGDIESLRMAEGVPEFKNRLERMVFIKRFPLPGEDLEDFLKIVPFSLAGKVVKSIPGSSALFFDIYLKIYELIDIKEIINGGEGFFVEEFRGKSFEMEDLNNHMQKGFWKNCWNSGFLRYKETHNKTDIQVTLDRCYYTLLLDGVSNLPSGEASETEEFIITLINFKNKLWLNRLKKFYNLQDFEIKRFLIPAGNVYENFAEEEGISEYEFIKEFKALCYRDFKFRMYSMRSILAFFFLFNFKINEILSIYRAKLLTLDSERFRGIWEELHVGS